MTTALLHIVIQYNLAFTRTCFSLIWSLYARDGGRRKCRGGEKDWEMEARVGFTAILDRAADVIVIVIIMFIGRR